MPCDQHEPSSDPYEGPRPDAPLGSDLEPSTAPDRPEPDRPELEPATASTEAEPDPLRLRNPTDLLAALPYLVEHPLTDAVVALVLGEGRVLGVLYAGLDHLDHVLTSERSGVSAVRAAMDGGGTGMLVAGFGRPARVTPHVQALITEARAREMPILEALRVTGDRYWSYLCRDGACCPAEGRPFDPNVSAVPAEAVLRGLVPADRDETNRIRDLLEPVRGVPGAVVSEAAEVEEERVLREDTERALVDRWIPEVHEALRREEGERVTEPVTLARLGVHLTDLRVRDSVWTRITPETAELHVRLWSRVARHVPERLRPAPAALLAVAAWQHEDQRLAKAALNVSLAADPEYSMAVLMRRALTWGLPAERWRGFVDERLEDEPERDEWDEEPP